MKYMATAACINECFLMVNIILSLMFLLLSIVSDPNQADQAQNQPPKLSDLELENIIDNILQQDDFNRDGYIDYAEFIKSQAGRG